MSGTIAERHSPPPPAPAGWFLVGRTGSRLDRLDVQDVPPVGLVADHASEHRFCLDSGGAEFDHAVTLSSLTTAKKNMPGA
jgi:hypothetical protein